MMFQRILVPLDGSDFSKRALSEAVDLARLSGASLVLLQAVQVSYTALPETYVATPDLYTQLLDQGRAEAQTNLQTTADELAGQGVKVDTVIVEGDPASAIIDYESDVDLVVMSTHGRSGLARFVYGSVAEKVLRHGTKPILLIRIPHDQR
jgi:nucleotide-binding universal stress UspA family protein